MAKVRKKKNGQWFIDYRVHGIRHRETVGNSKKLAMAVLNKRLLEIAEGKFLDKKEIVNVKFADFADEYIEIYAKHNKKSYKTDLVRLIALKPLIGNRYLHEITPRLVEEFKSKRIKEVKPATVNRELACLKHIFTIANEWGRVEQNPVKRVKMFRENNCRVRYLEQDEIERLLNACTGYLKNIVVIALNTGMRKSEILNLKWENINIKQGFIYLLDTKNGDKREIPINGTVKHVLITQRKHPKSPYVFYNKDGKPFGDIKKGFIAVLNRTGIIDFKFHDLRHTFASHLVMSGIDLNTVRELLGHKSIRMTLRYSHLSPAHKKKAVDILGKVFAKNSCLRGNKLACFSSL